MSPNTVGSQLNLLLFVHARSEKSVDIRRLGWLPRGLQPHLPSVGVMRVADQDESYAMLFTPLLHLGQARLMSRLFWEVPVQRSVVGLACLSEGFMHGREIAGGLRLEFERIDIEYGRRQNLQSYHAHDGEIRV